MAGGGDFKIERICDPHWHVWDTRPREEGGRGPNSNLGDLGKEIPRYTWSDMKAEWKDLPIKACVHVEATVGVDAETGVLDPVEETARVLAEGIDVDFAIVAHCSLQKEDAERVLEEHAKEPKVTGIRQIVNYVEGDAALTFPTVVKNYLLDETFKKNLKLLSKFGFTYDCHLAPEQLLDAAKTFGEVPEVKVVINHVACPRFRREGADDDAMWSLWTEGMKAVSKCPNVHVKLSNPSIPCSDFNKNPEDEAICRRLFRETIEMFGVERCFFASNFPVDRFQSGVQLPDLYMYYQKWVNDLSKDDLDALFYTNAVNFYRIPPL